MATGPAQTTDELEAAQYTGEVTGRAAAIEHLRGWAAGR